MTYQTIPIRLLLVATFVIGGCDQLNQSRRAGVAKSPSPKLRTAEQSPNESIPDLVSHLKAIGAIVDLDENGRIVGIFHQDPEGFTDKTMKRIAVLRHLRELWLTQTSVTDTGMVHLKSMSSLRILALCPPYESGIKTKITDVGLVHIRGLVNLEELWLVDSDVSDKGLIHLKGLHNLKHLDLQGTEVSDAGLTHLTGLKGLRYLNVEETQWEATNGAVTAKAAAKLNRSLPQCEIAY